MQRLDPTSTRRSHEPVLLVRQWQAAVPIPLSGWVQGLGLRGGDVTVKGDWKRVRVEAPEDSLRQGDV